MPEGHNRTMSVRPALRFYVHVPYCSSRCGYCDFNTYVAGEAGRGSKGQWRPAAQTEVRRARAALPDDARQVASVFFGGGTPTLLPVSDLAAVIVAIDSQFGLAADAEITVEANPENVTPGLLDDLLAAGVTRLSLGMQSADSGVLGTLDRKHGALSAVRAARLAQLAGFGQVSLDVIYGTPGETSESWRRTLEAVIDTGVTHVSAYALKVEVGTALARRIQRGEVAPTDDDQAAACYEAADAILTGAGLPWYEVSNWAVEGHECRHNLGYWSGDDWWGVGPGAHSHLAGTRFWNLRHPTRWAKALTAGEDPVEGRETLTADQMQMERVMLQIRLAAGFDPAELIQGDATAITSSLASRGLIETWGPRWRLTRRGRLLADGVTIEMLDSRIDHGP